MQESFDLFQFRYLLTGLIQPTQEAKIQFITFFFFTFFVVVVVVLRRREHYVSHFVLKEY